MYTVSGHEGCKDAIMPIESVKTTAKKMITELAVKSFWPLVILALSAGYAAIISFKEKIVQQPAYGEISFWLLLTTITSTVVLLLWIYWRYGRFREAFGVLWDKNNNMRCLSCKKPLKYSSTDESTLYCSDPKCNSKYVPRNTNGTKITRGEAIIHLPGLRALRKVRR